MLLLNLREIERARIFFKSGYYFHLIYKDDITHKNLILEKKNKICNRIWSRPSRKTGYYVFDPQDLHAAIISFIWPFGMPISNPRFLSLDLDPTKKSESKTLRMYLRCGWYCIRPGSGQEWCSIGSLVHLSVIRSFILMMYTYFNHFITHDSIL